MSRGEWLQDFKAYVDFLQSKTNKFCLKINFELNDGVKGKRMTIDNLPNLAVPYKTKAK